MYLHLIQCIIFSLWLMTDVLSNLTIPWKMAQDMCGPMSMFQRALPLITWFVTYMILISYLSTTSYKAMDMHAPRAEEAMHIS